MNTVWKPIALLALAALVACSGAQVAVGTGGMGLGVGVGASGPGGNADAAYRQEIDDWYRARVERLKADDGWLSLVGLFPLPEGVHTFGAADDNEFVLPGRAPAHAGTIVVARGRVHLTAVDGVPMTHDGEPVTDMDLETDAEGRPTQIVMGTFTFYVIDRPGSLYLRVKDADSPVRTSFQGIERYPVDPRWRVEAHWVPYDPPKHLTIRNIVGFTQDIECKGALAFSIDGKEYRLEPTVVEGDEFDMSFGDATNGDETYGGGRTVYIKIPDATGRTIIDFNKAYNPPCMFTHYATCPLPHAANVLPIKVEAGEKAWKSPQHP